MAVKSKAPLTAKLKFAGEELAAFEEMRHLYAVNKSLLLTYRDLCEQCLDTIKKEQLTYSKEGKPLGHGKVFYSTIA